MTRSARTSWISATRATPFASILRYTEKSDLGRPHTSAARGPVMPAPARAVAMAPAATVMAARCAPSSSSALSAACSAGCRHAKQASSSRALSVQMPRRDASGTYTASVSRASVSCASVSCASRTASSGARCCGVVRQCRRSASFTITTRASVMAISIARSCWRSSAASARGESREICDTCESLDTPCTIPVMAAPDTARSSAAVTGVASSTSCNNPVATTLESIPSSASTTAVSTQWRSTGSASSRRWPRCAAAATRNALTTPGERNAA
mmetsp:Transcript_817/g.1879  ORF Transcript_817/g.1879 Transcript_817/m.1879 type:complete len:270 (+) Transcript_817:1758-2567(+)